jgi:Histidine kinase-, DNA gyrase B-, and HSP90-like ATPase
MGGVPSIRPPHRPLVAIVSVTDTGIGIAREDIAHVFDRFWRADKARSREQGGAGLGLAIAKWIVETHKGSISVDSAPGNGSVFLLRIPVDRAVTIPFLPVAESLLPLTDSFGTAHIKGVRDYSDYPKKQECQACRKFFPTADLRPLGGIHVCGSCYPEARLIIHDSSAPAEIQHTDPLTGAPENPSV